MTATDLAYDEKPRTALTERAAELLIEIKDRPFSVLCGRNNCGKSFLLKSLKLAWTTGAAYLGPARYQNFNVLGNASPRKTSKQDEEWNQWYQQWVNHHQNLDNSK
jgi:AAA15 family ATPase/GTPase